MVDGFQIVEAQWKNCASVCAAVFKAAPKHLPYGIGAVDGTRPLPMRTDKTALCCRFSCVVVFVFQSRLGQQSDQSLEQNPSAAYSAAARRG
jgi:hypothetical protein